MAAKKKAPRKSVTVSATKKQPANASVADWERVYAERAAKRRPARKPVRRTRRAK